MQHFLLKKDACLVPALHMTSQPWLATWCVDGTDSPLANVKPIHTCLQFQDCTIRKIRDFLQLELRALGPASSHDFSHAEKAKMKQERTTLNLVPEVQLHSCFPLA